MNIILDEKQFFELKESSIGYRIRYLREVLYKQYGAKYNTRNVADRVKVISYAALAAIERGDTKEPSARLIHAVSLDFEIEIDVFFDDFYSDEYKPILIGPRNTSEYTNSKNISNDYTIGIYIYQEAENGDRRQILSKWSKARWNENLTLGFMTSVIQNIDTNDIIFNDSVPAEYTKHPLETASIHLEERKNNIVGFPWIPKKLRVRMENELLNQAQLYTKNLVERNELK